MQLRDMISSWRESFSDHSSETGRWYLNDAVMAVNVGPLRAGERIARIVVSLSPLGEARSFVLFYRSQAEADADEETHSAALQVSLSA
jgi:hypothetical protein